MEHDFILDKDYYFDKDYNTNDDWVDTYSYQEELDLIGGEYNLYYICKNCGIHGKKDLNNGEIVTYIDHYTCDEYIIKNIIE